MSFFNRIRPDPGFVSPVRSDPGFVSPIRSDPVRSDPGFVNGPRKRKIHVKEGKYKQRGSSSSTSSSGKGNTTCAWDRFDRLITTNDVKLHIQRHVLSSNLELNDSQK